MHYDYPSFAFSLLLLSLLFYFTYYFLFVCFFGCVTQLMGSQFPDQGLIEPLPLTLKTQSPDYWSSGIPNSLICFLYFVFFLEGLLLF